MKTRNRIVSFLGVGLGLLWALTTAKAQLLSTAPGKGAPQNFDLRLRGPAAVENLTGKSVAQTRSLAQGQSASSRKAIAQWQKKFPRGEARLSPTTGGMEMLRAPAGMTSASSLPGDAIVRSFLQENRDLFGLSASDLGQLRFVGESISKRSGLRMVRMEQQVNGRPVFQSESRFSMDRSGRLVRVVGGMVRDASVSAAPLQNLISPEQALSNAMASVQVALPAANVSRQAASPDGYEMKLMTRGSAVAGEVTTKLVYFPIAPGNLIPAWSQVAFTTGRSDWYIVTDARTGAVLWRKNIRASASTEDARFRVYVQADGVTPADNPAPLSPTTATVGSGLQAPGIAPTIVSMFLAQDVAVSPNGWIDDCPGGVCTSAQTQTIGNNVHAYMDAEGGANANMPDTDPAFVLDGAGKPMGNPDANGRNRDFLGTTPRDFQTNFLPPPQSGDPEMGQSASGNGNNGTLPVDQFRRGAVTQLFYISNWYHDRLYNLGFDEAAGNFQQLNFSGMGLGNDRVLAEAQDSSNTDNANFSTPPDGTSGRMQMYRFTGPNIDRDASLDSEIVMHELTHGVSNRLIGNGNGLQWDPGGGMGEGWSDFYALSLLNNTNADDPNGKYASGAYSTYKFVIDTTYVDNYLYGIRRFPYSTDNSVNPLTWADVDDVTNNLSGGIAPDPLGINNSGGDEVHNVGEIWCLTLWEVRSRVIADPAGANGSVPLGNQTMLQLVTDAMKLTPDNPSYTDARDALIDADGATNGYANEQSIWAGFADRGLGYGAVASTLYGIAPRASHQGIKESFSTPYLDIQTVTVDDSAGNNNGTLDPGEAAKLVVTLKNPWHTASKGVPSASATLTTSSPDVTITTGNSTYGPIAAQGSAAGTPFHVLVSSTATCGERVTFTVTTTSSLGTQSVSVDFRIGMAMGTGAPVTYTKSTGGLAIPDNHPRGVTSTMTITDDFQIADLNVRVDSLPHTFPGDLTFMVRAPSSYGVDYISYIGGLVPGGGDGDNITNMVIDDQATQDMYLATNAQAPYTGSWLPSFNSPSLTTAGYTPDPVGELSRLNGQSTQGTWTALVSDQASGDTGSLDSWSLIVTPAAFVCSGVAPGVVITATQSVSGTFNPGDTVTYTVTITNDGSAAQGDNPGNEFTETLPSSLTLVSASSTTGTAVATMGTNTVSWNGSLSAAGGSVTIMITATINSGASGTVSAQGTVNFDADANGSNESSKPTDDPSTVTPNDPTTFSVAGSSTPTPTPTATPTATPTPTTTPAATPARARNISTRLDVGAGDQVMIGGFIIKGSGKKHVVLRGRGPSLSHAGMPASSLLQDPKLQLHDGSGGVIAQNDNWMDGPSASQIAGGPYQPSDPREAVIVANLAPGAYTVVLSGADGGTGIGLVEAYDTDSTTTSELLNISTRGFVQTGDNVMIGGFMMDLTTGSTTVALRGLGPSLTTSGLSHTLADPTLEMHNSNGAIMVSNDNWTDDPVSAGRLTLNGLAPHDVRESGIVVDVPPGAYTVILRGKNDSVGQALVEVYNLH